MTREELYLVFQARIRGIISGKYKLLEYRSEQLKRTQLFDLEDDPWETRNLAGTAGTAELIAHLRERMAHYRDLWREEDNKFGRLYWQQYRQYEAAEVHGVPGPKGANMKNQINDWMKK